MDNLSIPKSHIRNIAIIAHVDHGKTTLVDHLLRQSGLYRSNQQVDERMMDSMDLERERGITIAAKNCSIHYKDYLINIVDTPGHSDFGAEVERILNMVDGAILLVDSSEGPLPQTRFVLKKALEQDIKVVVCINKIDRPDARIEDVENEILGLFYDLNATEAQASYPTVYAIAREGMATKDPTVHTGSLETLYNMIIEHLPAPRIQPTENLQMLVANIDYNDFVGRLAIGRIFSGTIEVGKDYMVMQEDKQVKMKVSALFQFSGNKQVKVDKIQAGDIAIVAGLEDIKIGDTISELANPVALPRLKVDEPTVGALLSVNDGPMAGREGQHVTSRKILERLQKELRHNVALRLEMTDRPEAWMLYGRGELQISILIEQMRREGYEILVGKPQVVFKNIEGQKSEPMELAIVDVPEEHVGIVTEKMGVRKGIMVNMMPVGKRMRLEFKVPSRGLIGYRSEFLTDTRGLGLLNTEFAGYEPYKGDIESRKTGALISDRAGKTTAYAIFNLEDRGKIMVVPTAEVYEGMVVGEHAKENDLVVNITREKKLTNVRASGADEAIRLTPVKPLTVEAALEWINDDEMVEVTPKNIRLRCRILDPNKRARAAKE